MASETTSSDPFRQIIHSLLDDLAALKGDLQVQAHLGTMELRDRLNGLEKRHAELHDSVRGASAEAVEGLKTSVSELKREAAMLRKDAGIDSEC